MVNGHEHRSTEKVKNRPQFPTIRAVEGRSGGLAADCVGVSAVRLGRGVLVEPEELERVIASGRKTIQEITPRQT